MDEQNRAKVDKLKKEIKTAAVKVSAELRIGDDDEAKAFDEGAKLARKMSRKYPTEIFLRALGEIAIEAADEIEREVDVPIPSTFLGVVLTTIDEKARAGYEQFKGIRERIQLVCSQPRAAAKLLWAIDALIVREFGTFEDVPEKIDVRRWVKTHRPQDLAVLPGVGAATVNLWKAIRFEYLEGIQ